MSADRTKSRPLEGQPLGGQPLKDEIFRRAAELGFARAGVAAVTPLSREGEALSRWVAQGMHADMTWLADTVAVRTDPAHPNMLSGARSVIALAAPYARPGAAVVGPAPGVVARYARGRDYHNVLGARLRKLEAWLRGVGYAARHSVDSRPVLERAWAQRAGVGFIGKNACLIVPGLGSHVLLATLVTAAELPADTPMEERCGSCDRCLTSCPTDAFAQSRVVDARRCISYLTIEQQGPIAPELREGIGDRFLGCDICQDVCPFNRTAAPALELTAPFAPDPRWSEHDAAAILAMDEAAFDVFSMGSPVRRARREGAARNAAIVLGNAGAKVHLPVLARAALEDPSETVREAAGWAHRRLEERLGASVGGDESSTT